jgi:hypothetical protein
MGESTFMVETAPSLNNISDRVYSLDEIEEEPVPMMEFP